MIVRIQVSHPARPVFVWLRRSSRSEAVRRERRVQIQVHQGKEMSGPRFNMFMSAFTTDCMMKSIRMQLYDHKTNKSASYIYIIGYSLVISHQKECCFSSIYLHHCICGSDLYNCSINMKFILCLRLNIIRFCSMIIIPIKASAELLSHRETHSSDSLLNQIWL